MKNFNTSTKWNYVGVFAGILVFSIALLTLHHLLAEVRLEDILAEFRSTPVNRIFICIFLVTCDYFVLTGYDSLALYHLGKTVPYPKTALASFTSYSVSHNIGLSFLTGGSVRYRIYSISGLSSVDIATLIIFCSFTFWIAVAMLMGIALLYEPGFFSVADRLSSLSNQIIGFILVSIVAGYILISTCYKKPLQFFHWSIRFPALNITLMQLLLGIIDLNLAACALYVLFPAEAGIDYLTLVGVYLAAISLGFLSNAPGGLGVFEAMMLLGLPQVDKEVLLGTLLMFRCLYYFLPLSIGMLLLGAHEGGQRQTEFEKLSKTVSMVGRLVTPRLIGTAVLIGGAILLFSGATPALQERMAILKLFVPLPFLEMSHLLASVFGLWLLILARGIFLRLDSAWLLTIFVLVAGIILSLLKGLDYEEALVLFVILLALFLNRSVFYRKGSLFNQAFTPGWLLTVLVIVTGSIWLGIFANKHIEYSDILWWQFTYHGDASRFMRASFAVFVLTLTWFAYLLMRPTKPEKDKNMVDTIIIKSIVSASNKIIPHLALTGDKQFMLSDNKDAFIMYNVQGRSWITMGDPVGPLNRWPELLLHFRQLADMYAGWPVFYQVDAETLSVYLDEGFSVFKIGEEANIDLANFTLEGSKNSDLRHTNRKFGQQGLEFSIFNSGDVLSKIQDLKAISDRWMELKSTGEKGFSVGFFDPDYISQCDIAVIKRRDQLIAFTNLWKAADKSELSIDLMRYLPDAPKGVMEYLFIQLMLWGKVNGYQRFSLGMAPLAGLQSHPLAPAWMKAGSFIFQHGEHFYNFEGLRSYKEKFNPVWKPKYIACPGGTGLPRILLDVAALIAGGPSRIFIK